jgi:hypothetical protein
MPGFSGSLANDPMNSPLFPCRLGPQRIVCLTEEPTEWLYLLGEERRIVGTSGCTVSPPQARVDKPKGKAFSDLQAFGKRVSTFYQGPK